MAVEDTDNRVHTIGGARGWNGGTGGGEEGQVVESMSGVEAWD